MSTKPRSRPAGPPAATTRGEGGVGRSNSPEAENVSDDLRRRSGPMLTRRRRVAGLSLAAAGSLGVVSLYQLGLVRHLPEPPLPLLDADRVDASGEAYNFLKTPDAAIGMISYAVTVALAGMGGADRARTMPWVPLALAVKVAVDVAGSAFLTLEQGTRHKRFCSWCLGATAASLATVPAVIPEARAAWRHLRG